MFKNQIRFHRKSKRDRSNFFIFYLLYTHFCDCFIHIVQQHLLANYLLFSNFNNYKLRNVWITWNDLCPDWGFVIMPIPWFSYKPLFYYTRLLETPFGIGTQIFGNINVTTSVICKISSFTFHLSVFIHINNNIPMRDDWGWIYGVQHLHSIVKLVGFSQ